ncbi:hypothetical protein A5757_01445 [Mycobacterium sp. 852013-51886_SCH5428379]|nr:hypothetical protein A5757_01445 [Mycobacterium sp. 852013-51886_SCH5428379]
MGQLVGGGELAEHEVVEQLSDAGRRAGLDDREIHATIRSGTQTGMKVPRHGTGQPAKPTAGLASRLLSRGCLRNLPKPMPLIDNVLDQGTTAVLYGKWGTGKSFVALDWAASVSTGRRWQGRSTAQRRVLYVAAEGAQGLQKRLDAWEVGRERAIDDQQLSVLPVAVNLLNGGEVIELCDIIRDGGFGFIVLDTLARCMVGADENSAKDTGIAVSAMAQLVQATPNARGVVLGIHHTGKDGKTLRGSSAIEGAADTVYSIKAGGVGFELIREKRKDGPQYDHHGLKLDPVAESCVVSNYSAGGGMGDRAMKLALTMLHHLPPAGATYSKLRKAAVDNGQTPSTFERALTDLRESEHVAKDGALYALTDAGRAWASTLTYPQTPLL